MNILHKKLDTAPLWLSSKPSIGYALYHEKFLTRQIWVDELFTSVIYVPQHVFAVLCGLLGVFLLVVSHTKTEDVNFACRLFAAGMLMVAGALSSLILLPHLVVSYTASAIVALFLRWRANGQNALWAARSPLAIGAFLLPFVFLFPFLSEILKWSEGTGTLLSSPEFTGQWLYVFAAVGLVAPLAMIGIGIVQLRTKAGMCYIDSPGKYGFFGIWVLAMVGLLGLLFGGYPDAGLKSGLCLRIALIPLAGIGILFLIDKIEPNPQKRILTTAIATLFLGIVALNLPTAIYFTRSAWVPLDSGIKSFVVYVRTLPEQSRIALFSSEQDLVALTGRQIDFDFSPIRQDSYMPKGERLRADTFWNGMKKRDPGKIEELNRRYDYLIAPVGLPANEWLTTFFTVRRSVSGYTVFETRKAH